ncbi:hypothetical protein A1D29_06980 [Pasteurellaceae bacterium Orientalotternb1]|nr:hypothetical protein A1D29_06980 [Pasteurellaceae bacterium Orientalotternb1]
MAQNIKLKKAPNLKKQPKGATECQIFIGSQAWDFAKTPQVERSQAEIDLNQLLPTWEFTPPIVLDVNELAEL